MKKMHTIIGVAAVLCILALIAAPASAFFPGGEKAQGGERCAGFPPHLDLLEEQGFDVSEIREAVENGDRELACSLMQQFREEHKDELPGSEGTAPYRRQPIAHLDSLEEQGYDVSEIRAAVESGDPELARTLMQQFMEEHKDQLPTPPQAGGFEKKTGGKRTSAE